MTSHPPAPDLVRKKSPSKWGKLRRILASVFDPRAWAHMIKLLNYYNYAHVQPLRKISVGAAPAISPNVAFANPERITLGARVRLGVRCVLWAGPARGRIVLGDDVMCGPEVMMTASSYRYDDGQPVTEQLMDEADVIVGHDVWIGTRAVLLPGTTIGDGAIVAAHAVVRGTVPPMAVVAGAPARVVSQRTLPQGTPDAS